MSDEIVTREPAGTSLIVRTAQRFGLEPARLKSTLKATCFKTEEPVTDEQMASLLIVAEQYHLNPFTRELFAFVDKKSGGIVPYVSVDGWARIINEHPMFDGMEFDGEDPGKSTCTIYRKDRQHPVRITEFLTECKRGSGAWTLTPRRMLRHRSMVQCARYAFGFALTDEDEARQIIQTINSRPVDMPTAASSLQRLKAASTPPESRSGAGADGGEEGDYDVANLLRSIRAANTREELQDVDDVVGALPEGPDKALLTEALLHRDGQMASAEEASSPTSGTET